MTPRHTKLFAATALAAALSAPVGAHAGLLGDVFNTVTAGVQEKIQRTLEWVGLNSPLYLVWKPVTLPSAACGDGSPYRFFINQSPGASNTVVFFEGGGACWNYNSCLNLEDVSAVNPNGIPRNYLNSLSVSSVAAYLASPTINRLGLDSPTPTRGLDWNYVFLPFCTGDFHAGNTVKTYRKDPADPGSATRTQYFKGHLNATLVSDWFVAQRSHALLSPVVKPATLLVTGQSAGGYGSTFNYSWIRSRMNPAQSGLFNDSGWFPNVASPQTSDAPYRGLPLRAQAHWNLNGPGGVVERHEKAFGQGLPDPGNMGDLPLAIAARWPADRFIYGSFIADQIIAAYANKAIKGEGLWTLDQLNAAHEAEIYRQIPRYDRLPNVGYYLPFGRDLASSHVLGTITFAGTRVQSQAGPSHDSVNAAILSALHRTPAPIRAVDRSREFQKAWPYALEKAVLPPYWPPANPGTWSQ